MLSVKELEIKKIRRKLERFPHSPIIEIIHAQEHLTRITVILTLFQTGTEFESQWRMYTELQGEKSRNRFWYDFKTN